MIQYPTQAELRALFEYKDGQLLRDGKAIGTLKTNGYIHAGINYKRYYVHRLIYIYHYGDADESLQIDHKNRDRTDNRIENLRLVTKADNSRNSGKGYHWNKQIKRFVVQLNGRHIASNLTECAARLNAAFARLT